MSIYSVYINCVRLFVCNATKGFATYGCFHPCFSLQDTQLKCLSQCKNQESLESSSVPSLSIDTNCQNDEQTDMSCSSSPSNSQSIASTTAVRTAMTSSPSQDDAIQCDKIESTTSSYDRLSLPAPVNIACEEFDQVRINLYFVTVHNGANQRKFFF